ncbi:MAG: hypothetical protein MZV63_06635 [Marinilabiliales bacterium]|nr:hypothetical protein [Marinilabiliales bacterium]
MVLPVLLTPEKTIVDVALEANAQSRRILHPDRCASSRRSVSSSDFERQGTVHGFRPHRRGFRRPVG